MQFYSKILLLLIAAVLVCRRVQCLPGGPPANVPGDRIQVCNDMLPRHGGATAQNGNGGYTIMTNLPRISNTEYAYTAGQTYTRKCINFVEPDIFTKKFSNFKFQRTCTLIGKANHI